MTEEIKVVDNNEEAVENKVQTPQYTEVEQQAMEQGWVPKDQWSGEGKWRDAESFLDRGELFSKIDSQRSEIKSVRQALDNLQKHYTKVKETEYNRAVEDLKRQAKMADREGDFERADRLEAEIKSVESEAATFKQEVAQVQQEAAEIHPEFAEWVQKNPWYASQRHMRQFADDEGIRFRQLGLAPKEVLKRVEESVKKEFPTKFTNPNRDKPSAVEGNSARKDVVKDDFVLSEAETRVMNELISQKNRDGTPFMTKAQYIADLKKIKGIK